MMKQLFMDLSKILLLLISGVAFAQQSNFNRSQLPHSTSSLTIHDGIDSYKGLGGEYNFHISAGYEYVESPYILVDEDKDIRLTEVIKDFTRIQLTTGLFFGKNFYLGATVPFDSVTSKPYVPGQLTQNIIAAPFSQETSSMGDIVLLSKLRLGAIDSSWNWTLIPKISLPTGSEESFNTDSGMTYALYAAWGKYFSKSLKWRFYGNLGFRYAPDSRLKISPLFDEFVTEKRGELGLGISYELMKNLTTSFEFKGFQAFPFNDGQNPVELTLGAAYRAKAFRIYAGVGLEGTLGEMYNNDTRYFAGISFNASKREPVIPQSVDVVSVEQDKKINQVVSSNEVSLMYQLRKSEVLVNFETSDDSIQARSARELVGFASLIVKNSERVSEITIEGHTDSRGELNSNALLSLERANRIKDLLIAHGVNEKVIRIKAYGEMKLESKEADQLGLYQNRRAEVYISGFRSVQ